MATTVQKIYYSKQHLLFKMYQHYSVFVRILFLFGGGMPLKGRFKWGPKVTFHNFYVLLAQDCGYSKGYIFIREGICLFLKTLIL